MTVNVKVPTQLRSLTGGESQVEATAETVKELVADLDARYPGLAARLCNEDGSLRRFINVYVDDEDVRFLKGVDTALGEGVTVSIIPAVAGG